MSEFSRHSPESPSVDPIDVLSFFNSPRFTEAVSYVNSQLAAFSDPSDMTFEQQEQEAQMLADFNNTFFGMYWQDRPTRATCSLQDESTNSTSELCAQSISGTFSGAVPELYLDNELVDRQTATYVSNVARRRLAIRIDDTEQYYTVPLNKQHLLELQVDVPPLPPVDDTLTSQLHTYNQVIQYFMSTPSYQRLSKKARYDKLQDALQKLNYHPQLIQANQTPTITTIIGSHGVSNIPGAGISITPPSTKNSLSTSGLQLQIFNPELGGTTTIPVSLVADIAPVTPANSPELASAHITDILNLFRSTDLNDAVNAAEYHINNAYDDDERNQAIIEAVSDIDAMLPESLISSEFYAQGTIFYAQVDDEELIPKTGNIIDGNIEGVDIQLIDGKWRVVLPIEYEQQGLPQLAYVVPFRSHTTTLEAYYTLPSDAEQLSDEEAMVQDLNSYAQHTSSIIMGKRFKKASRQRQVQLLQQAMEPLQSTIERIRCDSPSEAVVCLAASYYAVDSRLTSITWSDIAELAYVNTPDLPEHQRTPLEGRLVTADIPELSDIADSKFNGLADFPLSQGEPMVVVEDAARQIVYFIPAQSVKLLTPRYLHDREN